MNLTPITATAPSAWATYLINGDGSALEDDERAAADAFVVECLQGVAPSTCEDAGFMWNHDALRALPRQPATMASDCQRYTSLVEVETLPVIFRKSEGEVTAVFPTLPHDQTGRHLTVYAHVGQHGGAAWNWYSRTKAARPDEYADLLAELEGIYGRSMGPGDPVYRLQVYQRMTPAHRKAFEAEMQRLRQLQREAC